MESMKLDLLLPSHSDHDSIWQLPGNSDAGMTCLACLVECLEDPDALIVKKKRMLSELLRIFTVQQREDVSVLNRDIRVTAHLILILIEVAKSEDKSCVSLAVEAIFQVVCHTKSEHLVCCILDTVSHQSLKMCNYKKSLPMLSLLGRLLHTIPALASQLLMGYGSFVDYLCVGLSYPDSDVQVALVYIYVHLYSPASCQHVPAALGPRVAQGVLQILCSQQPQELHMNAIGLLKVMVENPSLVELFMSPVPGDCPAQGGSKTSLTVALKRLLLGRHNLLQVAAVQCTIAVVSHHTRGQHYADVLLLEDIAEFLFETLTTSNELLIGSVFRCLVLITDVEAFFKKCHAVYGIEAIMRAIDQALQLKASPVVHQGMLLLGIILTRHPGNVRLFSHVGLVKQCLGLVTKGATQSSHQVAVSSMEAFCTLLSRHHMPSPVPYLEVMSHLQSLTRKIQRLPKMRCKPALRTDPRRGNMKAEAAKALHTQQLLLAFLRVLSRACLLTERCKGDPMASITNFTTKLDATNKSEFSQCEDGCDYDGSDWDRLADNLRAAIADTALPLVMANLHYLDDGQTFSQLFSAMNALWKINPVKMMPFGKRLLAAGLIGFSLRARVQFKAEVEDEVVDLLANLYMAEHMEGSDQAKLNEQRFRKGLQNFQGNAGDLATVLRQNSAELGDSDLDSAQCAVLGLLAMASYNGDRPVPRETLCDALCVYLELHQHRVQNLPACMLRQIVFLVATSSIQTEAELPAGFIVLVRLLQRVASADTWCTVHPAILHWVFSHPVITEALAPTVVEHCLKATGPLEAGVRGDKAPAHRSEGHTPANVSAGHAPANRSADRAPANASTDRAPPNGSAMEEVDPTQLLTSLAVENHQCLETLMVLLSSENSTVVGKVVHVLCELLVDEKHNGGPVQLLRKYLPMALHDALLTNTNTEAADQHVCAMVDLLVTQRLTDYRADLTETDTKLAYHVSKLLTREEGSVPDCLQRAVLNLVTCLLIQSSNQDNTRVPSVLLSNVSLMRHLECAIRDPVKSPAMVVCALLAELQHRLRIGMEQVIQLREDHLMNTLMSCRAESRAAGLRLWTAFLGTNSCPDTGGSQPPAARQVAGLLTMLPVRHRRRPLEEQELRVPVSSRVLRTVLIHGLQGMAQENAIIQESAIDCFQAMIACVHHTELKGHLVEQPWSYLILQTINSSEDKAPLSMNGFRLCHMLSQNLQDGDGQQLATRLLRGHLVSLRELRPLPWEKSQAQTLQQLTEECERYLEGTTKEFSKDELAGISIKPRKPIMMNGVIFETGDAMFCQRA